MFNSQAAAGWSGAPAGRTFVKVKGTRFQRFIEFESSINGESLSRELIAPVSALREIREAQNAAILPSGPSAGDAAARAKSPVFKRL